MLPVSDDLHSLLSSQTTRVRDVVRWRAADACKRGSSEFVYDHLAGFLRYEWWRRDGLA